jgi:hypothetical protein
LVTPSEPRGKPDSRNLTPSPSLSYNHPHRPTLERLAYFILFYWGFISDESTGSMRLLLFDVHGDHFEEVRLPVVFFGQLWIEQSNFSDLRPQYSILTLG